VSAATDRKAAGARWITLAAMTVADYLDADRARSG
jgi:hypothetical protein